MTSESCFKMPEDGLVLCPGVKLKLFCPEAKKSSPLFKLIELWGTDLIEWGAILVEVNFYHSSSSQLKRVSTISRIVCGSLHIHAKHVKCGGNDAVNELGTVHVLVVICRLSDWLNKTESNCRPRARSSPQSFAPFIKTIPASANIRSAEQKYIYSIVPIANSMPCIMLKTRAYGEYNGVEVFGMCVSTMMYYNAVFMDRYARLQWFLCQRVD
jgi:hypothetical protein